jgi:GntR family transcriptional regulator/MocR family aminotransferase
MRWAVRSTCHAAETLQRSQGVTSSSAPSSALLSAPPSAFATTTMPKRATTLPLALPQRDERQPAALWLASALRTEILEGRLRPGARLPATRDLARQYGLSRGTIVSAFDRLKSEGYVEGSVGAGTFVNQTLPDELLHVSRKPATRSPDRRARQHRLSAFARRADFFPGFPKGPARPFRTAEPALDLFPTTLWAQLAGRRIRRATATMLLQCDVVGYRPFREAVAEYLATSRGVRCSPDQIIIVSGLQEALDLIARVCLDPGDRVGLENPGYIGTTFVLEAHGAKISPLQIDAEGMEVPPRRLRNLRLVYVTPGHQFPLGVSMSLARRLALLEWARSSDAMIIEDDYDSEYRYSGRPLPALQGLDRDGQVMFTGSFSKVLFPSLRLGYLVVPPDLMERVTAVKSVTTRHAPVLEQAIVCDFISEGHFGRHIRRMREVYAERLGVLLDAARKDLDGLLEISDIEAGLQTVGWLNDGIDDRVAAKACAERGIEVFALSRYWRGRPVRPGLHMGFATFDGQEIRRGVRELAGVLERLSK